MIISLTKGGIIIFSLRKNLTSYRSPIKRILLSVLVLVLIFNRNYYIHIQSQLGNGILMFICLVIVCLSILCIYISLLESYNVFVKRHIGKTKRSTATQFIQMDTLIKALVENDIIEIEVLCHNDVIKIGASSCCKHNNMVFYDKQYYIDTCNYSTIEEFKAALANEVSGQECEIVAIDGCNAKHYNL